MHLWVSRRLGMNVLLDHEVAPLHLNLAQAMSNPLSVLAIVMTINNMGMCPIHNEEWQRYEPQWRQLQPYATAEVP